MKLRKIVRFADLQASGLVDNRVTLARWMKDGGFPTPFPLGPNSIAWYEDEVLEWLSRRKAEREAMEAARKAKGAALAEARAARRRAKAA